jgi:hypothetical protein
MSQEKISAVTSFGEVLGAMSIYAGEISIRKTGWQWTLIFIQGINYP